jgi:sec-independent protein translocase protein TatA
MPNVGPMELILVLVVALLFLGPKRLPSAARSLGEGMRGFKESLTGAAPPADIVTAGEPVREQADASI